LPKHLPAGRQERNSAGLVVYIVTSPLFLGRFNSSLLRTHEERRLNSTKKLLKFLKNHAGASAVEYALLVALITAVIVAAVTLLGGNLKATYDYIASIFLNP
jgi:pilus assembly protein Flp/PilA